MITRRRALASGLASGALLCAGCLSTLSEEVPVHVSVINARPERFEAEMTLRGIDDELLFRSDLVIPEPEGEREILTFRDVARIPDGDRVDAEMVVNGERYTAGQAVTCEDGTPSNVFRFVVFRGEEAVTPTGMDLQAISDGGEFGGC